MNPAIDSLLAATSPDVYRVRTKAPGPEGRLPITAEYLAERPSGDLFGLTQNVGMGWNPAELGRKQFLILSTQGGVRAPDGSPIALGYHTGHWEIGLLVEAAARELRRLGGIPFAGTCSDPSDGRTQGCPRRFDPFARGAHDGGARLREMRDHGLEQPSPGAPGDRIGDQQEATSGRADHRGMVVGRGAWQETAAAYSADDGFTTGDL